MNMIVLLCLFSFLLGYYCEQYITKFAIKTRVVRYELVKQLSLIIMADLHY
jgi:hypothetical protein